MPASPQKNGGYLFPDKGKGRCTLEGQDVFLTCSWAGADRQVLNIESRDAGQGKGLLRPNEHKTQENHPDWKGEWTDGAGKKWDLGSWKRDKDGDVMFTLSLTDPAVWASRRAAAGNPAAASAPARAPAPAPNSDPNAMGPIVPSDFDNMGFNDPFSPGS